mmetsp:Transcript_8003/g.9221  ORF Transcript_8003/g.9221 Transcript_8003/m.9221 type:complete len:840 (+) Transcript_8003:109-2628(+)
MLSCLLAFPNFFLAFFTLASSSRQFSRVAAFPLHPSSFVASASSSSSRIKHISKKKLQLSNLRMAKPIQRQQLHDDEEKEQKQKQGDEEQKMSSQSEPVWCEEQQIYINGTIASSSDAEKHINSILKSISLSATSTSTTTATATTSIVESSEQLHIFGYGSLCWNPGSSDEVLANPRVIKQVAKAVGWKRCWCQKSTDHRGDVSFPGLVCTLLSDEEISIIKREQRRQFLGLDQLDESSEERDTNTSMTEGVLYTIPPDLAEQCLAELDFREKGGYARDVIQVVLKVKENELSSSSQSDKEVRYEKALLYRGTPENPAFSKRALLDPIYASAIMSMAVGPSGSNDAYLFNLENFLSNTLQNSSNDEAKSILGDVQTQQLALITHKLQNYHDTYILFGAGSNQHNQLLLSHTVKSNDDVILNSADLVNGEDAHSLSELILITPKPKVQSYQKSAAFQNSRPKKLFAGGGHSALLNEHNDLYLWGWNESGQLGACPTSSTNKGDVSISLPEILPLGLKVSDAALGHNHTLVIEESTGNLYCFGDDRRGQVSGCQRKNICSEQQKLMCTTPTTPSFAKHEKYIHVDSGLFHSAGITSEGELVTWGCGRFGQCLPVGDDNDGDGSLCVARWRPEDGSRLIKVACGRRHTMVLDEHGRVWTMGENQKYGQLGRTKVVDKSNKLQIPALVDGFLGTKGSGCVNIICGWSHNIAIVEKNTSEIKNEIDLKPQIQVFGWGRNDKCQLGTLTQNNNSFIDFPQLILESIDGKRIVDVCCGAESILLLDEDGQMHGSGWNEHGNLSTGRAEDSSVFVKVTGAKIRNANVSLSKRIIMAAGGAHFLTAMT